MDTAKNILPDREVGSSTSETNQFDFDKFSVDHNLKPYALLKSGNEDVRAMTFNSTGRLLVAATGKEIKHWEWKPKSEESKPKNEESSFPQHQHYLTDLQIMPQSNDEKIVTCGRSGEVTLVSVSDSAIERKRLGKHQGTAYQLAILDQDTFYSCGEDSVVKHFDLREADHSVKDVIKCCRLPKMKQFSSPRLSTIAVDPLNNNMFSVGGSELTLRTYDIRKCSATRDLPVEIVRHSDLEYKYSEPLDWVKTISYSCKTELMVLRENGKIFLFDKTSPAQERGEPSLRAKVITYRGSADAYDFGCSSLFGREDDYVLGTTKDRFKLFIWDKKTGSPKNVLGNKHIKMDRLARHPSEPVLATAGDSLWIWAP